MRLPLPTFRLLGLWLLALLPLATAADTKPDTRETIDLDIRTTFPDSTVDTLGLFYNGRTSRVDVSVTNREKEQVVVHFIGGSFNDIATLKPILNLTSKVYETPLAPGEQSIFPFQVQTYFPGPRVLHLALGLQFSLGKAVYQSVAYNGTVTIADPPSSFFDVQALFLYIILAAAFAGAGYLVYSTWIKTVLPKKKGPKTQKKKEPIVAKGNVQNYEEWIPQHHLKKESTPSARKRKA